MNYKRILNVFIYIFALIGFMFVVGYFAIRLGFTNNSGIIDDNDRFLVQPEEIESGTTTNPVDWNKSPEWQALTLALQKDRELINRVSQEVDIDPRTLVSVLIVEQLRLFNDDRESFKKFFEPLKILGSQSVFSWGVLGIKRETAIEVENNLKNPSSPRYLGKEYENMLDFSTADTEKERFERITDQRDHYYSYLYGALFIKQIEAEWERAGFPINNRPEIIATIYNLGFARSLPKPDPQVGGAIIPIAGKNYSFGGMAYDFYHSDELTTEFPR